ncbi:MAG TPA: metal-dependent transcriptional regulator [Acholeplasmataceae bacterium]|nr:metal-dependent transcriptional regulator [Acholeplasmataceae bacterium]
MNLTKSIEDYLEAILIVEKRDKKVKSVKIAELLGVSKPGVNKAMNVLKDNNLIDKADYGDITLTDKGREIANRIYEKHLLIKEFLIILGVSEETAEQDCCKIEHILSDETLKQINNFLNNNRKRHF